MTTAIRQEEAPAATPGAAIFEASPSEHQVLRQGEVLCGVLEYRVLSKPAEGTDIPVLPVAHSYAIVLSQDCDLLRDYESRLHNNTGNLENVLLVVADEADNARRGINGSDLWKRVRTNKDERYQFLEKAPPDKDLTAVGVPELVIDFKRYFTLPTDLVYDSLLNGCTRRTVLLTPYKEHLCSRFSFYISRVALPRPHVSD
jgi:hypothetical protein